MYNNLITKPFINKKVKQPVNRKMIIKEVMNCYKNIAFSTFPYINNLYTSKESIKYTNSGNCIGLSIYIKELLKKKYNIISYLIPATVPSYVMKEGYLDICHVALAIPIDANNYFIIDPAFYFLEPIKVNLLTKKTNNIKSVQIDGFTDIQIVKTSLKKTDSKLVLNKYQSIPKNTFYCECYSQKEITDTWKYFLREVINPDKSISNFFIKIRNNPFFVSTNVKNSVCVKEISIRTLSNNNITIQIGNQIIYSGSKFDIPLNIKNYVINLLQQRNFDASIMLQ